MGEEEGSAGSGRSQRRYHKYDKPIPRELETTYETNGDTVYCWLFGPRDLVESARQRIFSKHHTADYGTRVIQTITLEDDWISIGISRSRIPIHPVAPNCLLPIPVAS